MANHSQKPCLRLTFDFYWISTLESTPRSAEAEVGWGNGSHERTAGLRLSEYLCLITPWENTRLRLLEGFDSLQEGIAPNFPPINVNLPGASQRWGLRYVRGRHPHPTRSTEGACWLRGSAVFPKATGNIMPELPHWSSWRSDTSPEPKGKQLSKGKKTLCHHPPVLFETFASFEAIVSVLLLCIDHFW